MRLKIAVASILVAFAGAVQAAPVKYEFSGTLTYGITPAEGTWPFAADQQFSGSFVYDGAAAIDSLDYINQPGWQLTFHRSVLQSFEFSIGTPGAPYHYVVPANAPGVYATVANGTDPLYPEGVGFSLHNYRAAWGGGSAGQPAVPVPDSAYVGALYPHAVILSLESYTNRDLVDDTGADIDLEALFNEVKATGNQWEASFAVRFTDPADPRWSGMEALLGLVGGSIDRLVRVDDSPVDVPEPATAGLLGLGLLAIARRRRVS